MFKLEIETTNRSFGVTLWERHAEVARILRHIADRLDRQIECDDCRDRMGASVGAHWFTDND
jgi:hypothetical protein